MNGAGSCLGLTRDVKTSSSVRQAENLCVSAHRHERGYRHIRAALEGNVKK